MDERAIYHRYKATRLAVLAGTLVVFGWFQYEILVKDTIRWDYVIILGVMAVVKLAARLYFKKKN